MFKLSPFQYHAMSPRQRMAAALSGLAGFSEGVMVGSANGPATMLVPAGAKKSMVESTLMAPVVGSGVIPSRVQVKTAGDQLDLRRHSVLNPPGYELMNAPGRYASDVSRLAGLGVALNRVRGDIEEKLNASMDAAVNNLVRNLELEQSKRGFDVSPLPKTLEGALVDLDRTKGQIGPVLQDAQRMSERCRTNRTTSKSEDCALATQLQRRADALNAKMEALNKLVAGLQRLSSRSSFSTPAALRRPVSTGPAAPAPKPGAQYAWQKAATPTATPTLPTDGRNMGGRQGTVLTRESNIPAGGGSSNTTSSNTTTTSSDTGGSGGSGGGGTTSTAGGENSYTETDNVLPGADVYGGAQNVIPLQPGIPTWMWVAGAVGVGAFLLWRK